MAKLTDYLSAETLAEIEASLSAAAGTAVRVVDDAGAPGEAVVVDGQAVGAVRFADGAGAPAGGQAALRAAATMLGRLWDRERELRARGHELATLYRLHAEFAGRRDLQQVLDLTAKTVVEAMGVKACSIRLLDEERSELVIKAVANISQEYLNKGPILLSESRIDQEVLSTNKMVYIADERSDPRVLYPAEARREGIVSALCAPLIYKGRPVGVLRVYTAEVHEFTWFETSLLHAIAAAAAAAIVNAQLHEDSLHAARMERALATAGEVQRRMIPEKPPEVPGLQIGAVFVPTYELSGDFYDFIPLPEGNLGLAIADVVGKGVRASLLMASIRAALRAHATNVYDMSRVIDCVNRDLCDDTLLSDFATLFYGVIDVPTRRLTYANAGHVPPCLFRDGRCTELTTGGGVLGIDTGFTWRQEWIDLRRGDVVLMYTDGLSDALNFNDEAFGRERVRQAALAAIADRRDAQGVVKHVLWEMRRFAGLQTRTDDVSIVAVKVEG